MKKLGEGKITDGEVRGTLRVLFFEDSAAAPTPEFLSIFREKHPPECPDSSFPDLPDQTILPDEVTVEKVVAAVKNFPDGSAGGVGLRLQHFKDKLSGSLNGAKVALSEAPAKLTTLMQQGKVPDAVCGVLYGASLTTLR
ncbi:hypothetical protein RvY_03123 [Ramazzottius varieornatus]|uniref:Uncharacterized protein n=1 Tax=Ramazzottius varieornatus TaxID=947166 RepID=A0A1D1UX60_RAMVA|nr:hypothetical protein RvY_03123 [Ramazzottius varieornatus]